jgi:hypothetical protein
VLRIDQNPRVLFFNLFLYHNMAYPMRQYGVESSSVVVDKSVVKKTCRTRGIGGYGINEVLPGFEPGSLDSESRVLTITP